MTKARSQSAGTRPGSGLRSSLVFSVMTFLSRILGLVRDVVIAFHFGSQPAIDAFLVAFRIPNFLRRLFAEGAFSQAFVPVLVACQEKTSRAEACALVARVVGTLGTMLVGLTALAVLASPVLVALFAPGFRGQPEQLELAGTMLRITFPYLPLISLTALTGAVLNSHGRFAVPAATPMLLNLSLIGAALLLGDHFEQPVMALAWGVLVAGCAQLLFQLPFVGALGMLSWPVWSWHDSQVRRILALMVPALLGVSVGQINLFLDTVLASFLQAGSISWLYYANRLLEFPLGVFGVAIATVVLPSLSRLKANDRSELFSSTLDRAVRQMLLIGLPAALALHLLAHPLLTGLFHYGSMTARDLDMTASALRAYALALPSLMLVKVLAPGYYACQDTRTPMRMALVAMLANMVLNLILVGPLHHVGLALATALSSLLNVVLLLRGLVGRIFQPSPGWLAYGLRLLVANGAMGATLCLLMQPADQWLGWSLWQRAIQLAVLVLGGFLAYVLALLAVGLRPRHLVVSVPDEAAGSG